MKDTDILLKINTKIHGLLLPKIIVLSFMNMK